MPSISLYYKLFGCLESTISFEARQGVKDFQFLSVSLMDESCDYIKVRKFVWPLNDYEQLESNRLLTRNNIKQMVFKHGSEKPKNEKVYKYLDGAGV